VPGSEPQRILSGLTEAAVFLTLTVRDRTLHDDTAAGVRDVLADLGGIRRSVGFRGPGSDLTCVVGIGSDAWDRLFGDPRPAWLHPFPGFEGAVHRAPATPGDLLVHIRAHRMDLCFELAHRIVDRLAGLADVVDEVHGFRYFDDRDLLGFVDGTENPEGDEAAAAVLVTDEPAPFTGGSYLITQKYVHDLAAWNELTVEQQERAIGRTKLDDIEMADDVKPSNSHVALNTIVDADGEERDIMRFNMPFGSVGAGEFGTYFIGYARTPDVIEQMLENMFVGKPPGNHDRILDFSTALTGNLFFVPPAPFLDDPAGTDPGPATAAVDPPAAPDATHDGDYSLGIGSLRGQ
jgi:putative iron-dependent peroxidase